MESEKTSGFSWGRVARLFSPHRRRVGAVVLLVLGTSVLSVVNPLLIQIVFDDALFADGGPDMNLLFALTAAMIGITIAVGALGVGQTLATNRLGQTVLRDLRDDLFAHLQRLGLRFYGSARTGDLQSRLSSDVGGVQTAVTTTLSSILSNSVSLLSAVVAMLILSWQLTLVALATVPLFVMATRAVGRRRERFTGETQAATSAMNVVTQERLSVSGITLSRLFGRQASEIERFSDANAALAESATRQQVIGQAFFTVVQAFLGATPILVYLIAGVLLDRGTNLTAGTIVAFTTLQNRLFFPVARMLETFVELQSSRAMFKRIFTYLDTEPDIVEKPDAVVIAPSSSQGVVAFDGVEFGYDDGSTATLESVTFVARPGTLTAFVGSSGAGKSTILNLAARLYDVDSGTITLDGYDVRDLTLSSLADSIGMVTQESFLFADTLRANIAYGRPEATDAEVEKAARAAAIHDRIIEFDEGYDTVVGERGFRLSGGERQRIAIARVLLHDPKVLLLDEATSALDTASERKIQAALGELVSGRTTLAVAHRLSTIQAADTIHVIDAGSIVESGTHDELLALGGAYRRLYDEQFGGGEIETHCVDGVVWSDGSCGPDEQRVTARRHLRRRSGEAERPTTSGR